MYAPENTIFIALCAATCMILGIIGYFLYSMIRLHRGYLALHDSHNQARIIALDQERRMIFADVHDDFGPTLSAVKYKLSAVETTGPYHQSLLEESAAHLDSIVTRIRQLVREFTPVSNGARGPFYALDRFIKELASAFPLQILFEPVTVEGMPTGHSVHIYRMLQEIIHNCIKHAHARQLLIQADVLDKELYILTVDDGKGFDPEQTMTGGLGLENLRARAQILHANLYIESRLGEGTRHKIVIPLP